MAPQSPQPDSLQSKIDKIASASKVRNPEGFKLPSIKVLEKEAAAAAAAAIFNADFQAPQAPNSPGLASLGSSSSQGSGNEGNFVNVNSGQMVVLLDNARNVSQLLHSVIL